MKIIKIRYSFLVFCISIFTAIHVQAQEGYPVPLKTKTMLFYFQRNHNKNTIVYELNTLPDGKIDIDKPVNAFWIRFEEGGVKKEFSFLQSRAFGIKCKMVDKTKESFILQFNSFSERAIYLLRTGNSDNYKAYMYIKGELSELTHIFMKSENNSLGFPLSVKYVDISGISLKNRENVIERFIP